MSGMVSAIVLAANSEDSIARALDSLEWCKEVIVVDDFSTDKTVEIAKKRKAKVYERHLVDDFASQRNYGLEKAAGEWVLFIDSDEVVSKKLADEITKSLEIDCVGFYIPRQDYLFGKRILFGETSKVKLLRLAKKDAGRWERPVHEVWKVKGLTGELTEQIDHFPHPNVAQFIREINRYSTLNAKYLHGQNVRVTWWHILGYPVAKFFVDYVWYQGFRDGTPGAVIAIVMSMHSFLTRAKLWFLWHKREKI